MSPLFLWFPELNLCSYKCFLNRSLYSELRMALSFTQPLLPQQVQLPQPLRPQRSL